MSNIETIREYLVKLGADVDLESMVKFDSQLNRMSKKVTQVFSLIGKTVTRLSLAYTGLIVSTYKFSTSVAQSDMDLQRWARRMYMTEDGARSLKRTLDAMGLSSLEDLQDVALNPELKGQFLELRKLADQLSPSQEVKNNLREIRAIAFEFTKLKLQISYFADNLASSIYKHSRPAVDRFKKWLQDINESLFNNMESWADKIGKVIGDSINFIARMIDRFVELLGDLKKFYEEFPNISKAAIGAVTSWMLVFKTSGFMKTLLIFQSILSLYDDYKKYKEGANPEDLMFPRLWAASEKGIFEEGGYADLLKELLDKFIAFFNRLTDEVARIFRALTDKILHDLHVRWPNIFNEPESYRDPLEVFQEVMASKSEALNPLIEKMDQATRDRLGYSGWGKPTPVTEGGYYQPTYDESITVNINGPLTTDAEEVGRKIADEIRERALEFRRIRGIKL